MAPIMIPTLLFWENKNTWYGSKGLARFYIKTAQVELEEGKNENQLREIATNMARQRGVDLDGLAQQLGVQIPK